MKSLLKICPRNLSSTIRNVRKFSAEHKINNNELKKFVEIKIDTSTMPPMRDMGDFDPTSAIPSNTILPSAGPSQKEEPTPLSIDLQSYIKMRGPISLHDYMTQCLNHPLYGYYQRKNVSKIGKEGDFITAPEISQLFGEIIAIWLVSTWQSMGCPSKIDIIEMGPGNGTLIADIVRISKRFPSFHKALNIILIERSEDMRKLQLNKLSCRAMNPTDLKNIKWKTIEGISVEWINFLQETKSINPSLIIGQEFLDVFPVHQFVYTKNGWREKLIDIDVDPTTPYHFRTVLSNSTTPATRAILGNNNIKYKSIELSGNLSDLLDKTDYNKQTNNENNESNDNKSNDKNSNNDLIELSTKEGDGFELSPSALAVCEDVAIRLQKLGGSSLFIDYGNNFTINDSIRAFKKHQQVNYLSTPGENDMTVDIDFSSCIKIAKRYNINCYNIITQKDFLLNMGIIDRLTKLLESENVSEEQANHLFQSFKVLIDENQMGTRFKVMCLSHPDVKVAGFPELSK